MIGSQSLGRRPQIAWGDPAVLGVFDPGAVGQGQQRRHRQHQPVSGDACRVGAPGLVPLPAQALDGLEASSIQKRRADAAQGPEGGLQSLLQRQEGLAGGELCVAPP